MKLYFLRHGVAEDPAPGQSDAERRLTADGVDAMRKEAAALARMGRKLDLIVTSPLPRASETAQIVAEALGCADLVRFDQRLAPGFGMGELRDLLADLPAPESVMLVGHQPDLGAVSGRLVGAGMLDLKKGGLVRLSTESLEPGAAALEWLLPPSLLKLAGSKR